jgi:anhydro-N-acetylmuramic acid kinase
MAAEGTVCAELLQELLADPYYRLVPPKSTGREMFGRAFAEKLWAEKDVRGLSAADLVATATALTAATIVEAYESFVLPSTPVHEVIVSGGGARNKTLLQMLRDRLPAGIQLMTTDAYGIPDEAKEAIAFAILGHETLMGRPSNVPSVTGAKRAVVLGTICY